MPQGSQRSAQKLRFRRFIIASSNYPVLIAVAALFDNLGYSSVSQQQLLLMSLLALVLVGFLLSIFVSNNNLKFNDPSLTGLQIAVSSLWGMGPFLILPEIRPLLLMLYFPSFTFGILRFNRRTVCTDFFLCCVSLYSGVVNGVFLSTTAARTDL